MIKSAAKNLIKAFAVAGLSSAPLQWLFMRLHREQTVFFTYHGVLRDSEYKKAYLSVLETQFRRQLEFFKEYFDIITIDEAIEHRRRQNKQPAMVMTFDDGYLNNLEVALPILEEFEIPTTIYFSTRNIMEGKMFWWDKVWWTMRQSGVKRTDLSDIADPFGVHDFTGSKFHRRQSFLRVLDCVKDSDHSRREEIVEAVVERFIKSAGEGQIDTNPKDKAYAPLTPEQVSELAAHPLITVGSHSHCHNLLDQIPPDKVRESLVKSNEILKQWTGVEARHFSYPNGNYNATAATIVKELGYISGVTAKRGFFKKGDNPFIINRFGAAYSTEMNFLKARLTGMLELADRFRR